VRFYCILAALAETRPASSDDSFRQLRNIFKNIFLPPPPWPNSSHWPMTSSLLRFLYHTQRHATVGRTSMDECSARRRDPYLTTQHSQQTDRRTPCGIRTRNASERAAADPRLRPRGHRDRHLNKNIQPNTTVVFYVKLHV